MKKLLIAAAFVVTLGACASTATEQASTTVVPNASTNSSAATDSLSVEVPAADSATQDAPAVISDTADADSVPEALALVDATVAADPSVVELDDDVLIPTVVYALTFDAGTEWEIPTHVAIPEGWTYVAEQTSFVNGSSSISFETGCSEGCQPTAWDVELALPGGFHDSPMAGLAEDGVEGFGVVIGDGTSSTTQSREFDDGSGRAAVALHHPQGGRWLGCTADSASGSDVDLETLTSLCQAIDADWSTVLANTQVPEVVEVISPELQALLDAPLTGVDPQVVSLQDDGDYTAQLYLPEDATVSGDNSFATSVTFDDSDSFFSGLSITAECRGFCTPQDWEANLNAPDGELGRVRSSVTVVNDTPIDSGWIVSGDRRSGDGAAGVVVRWDDAADRYFACSIEAGGADSDQINEMIAICVAAEPNWLG